jgi:hypothetical protein
VKQRSNLRDAKKYVVRMTTRVLLFDFFAAGNTFESLAA